MSYTPPYIPRADAAFRTMAENFANGISNDPPRYMLTAAEAQSIMAQYLSFNEAFMVAVNPKTRTRGTIAAKDDARSILRHTIRSYAAFVRVNQGITDGDKIGIGVRPQNVAHGKRRCPHTSPLLSFLGAPIGTDVLFFTDSNNPNSRAKPYGAAQLQLYVAYSVAGEPWPKESAARYLGSFRKNPIRVPHDVAQDERGAKPTYWARWQGHDMELGPWSLPTSLAIARAEAAKAAAAKTDADEQADQPMRLAA